jgi:hypothetical protein
MKLLSGIERNKAIQEIRFSKSRNFTLNYIDIHDSFNAIGKKIVKWSEINDGYSVVADDNTVYYIDSSYVYTAMIFGDCSIVYKHNMPILPRLYTTMLNGKHIGYSSLTEFYVETGRNKSAYKVRYKIVGSLSQAVFYYNAINIGNGYKKRLKMYDTVLARQFS